MKLVAEMEKPKKSEGTELGLVMFGGCIMVFLAIAMIIYATLVGGYVLSILWGWFITPVFDIVAPGVLACSGIIMFVNYLTGRDTKALASSQSETKDNGGTRLVLLFLAPWITLFFGWVLHSFM